MPSGTTRLLSSAAIVDNAVSIVDRNLPRATRRWGEKDNDGTQIARAYTSESRNTEGAIVEMRGSRGSAPRTGGAGSALVWRLWPGARRALAVRRISFPDQDFRILDASSPEAAFQGSRALKSNRFPATSYWWRR
jgi:hypothetical protein